MKYKSLEEYGLLGNSETCSLVGTDGSIDWFPVPELASPSVFAALLDAERGGFSAIRPTDEYDSEQSYVPRTNVLETTFETDSGIVTLTDFMPVVGNDRIPDVPARAIYRQVECHSGAVEIEVEFAPRFDYARAETTIGPIEDGVLARSEGESLFLGGSLPLAIEDGEAVARGTRTLETGESLRFSLQYGTCEPLSSAAFERALSGTIAYWREWARRCTHPSRCVFDSPRYDLVVRSALTLKLLIHHSTGAIAAAPTTSLPEELGGVRNWDYRYSWLRDSALAVQALYRLGNTAEAKRYLSWCLGLAESDLVDLDGPLYRPIYGLRGETELEEEVLDGLEGYRGSSPVRVGNAAREQRQLDVYGELVLAVQETSRHGETLSEGTWPTVRRLIEYVRMVWDEPGSGIWEVRSEPRQFVYSKVMCWVALDRGIALAESQGFDAPIEEWRACREEIRAIVLREGFDPSIGEQGSFTRTFEGSGEDADLDATSLLLPVVGFLPFEDPRVQGTIDAVLDRLRTEEGLVYRYEADDGVAGGDNPFLLCSFWLVDALALSGRIAEAEAIFESVVEYASPLGLFAEEVDPATGEARGNFPQAFSHIGLINSALYLSEARERVLDTEALDEPARPGEPAEPVEPTESAPDPIGTEASEIEGEPGQSD
ncbi:glycoside hydrolase family 15 protein [Halobacteriales archaeon QS_3_64_16]|nr:MAG: glycoside hydrolase family 15 protein [Halobacteriales archaeon QS_3_64_16]